MHRYVYIGNACDFHVTSLYICINDVISRLTAMGGSRNNVQGT